MRLLFIAASLVMFAAALSAQSGPDEDRPAVRLVLPSAAGLTLEQTTDNGRDNGRDRDSLWNGAAIGAAIGGGATTAFVAFVCHALKEPGDPSCWGGVLAVGALGAGVGAAAGAGIDALRSEATWRSPAWRHESPQSRRIAIAWQQRF
jgi:hypothetical protein